jgi:actin cytoskeleton-regulatory complex protein PAN1
MYTLNKHMVANHLNYSTEIGLPITPHRPSLSSHIEDHSANLASMDVPQSNPTVVKDSADGKDDASDWDSDENDDSYETADSLESSSEDEEEPQTEEQRKAERESRELERQRVLSAAGLIIMKSEREPPPRPARRKSARKHRPAPAVPTTRQTTARVSKDLPSLPGNESADAPLKLDDAYERYEAFKQTSTNLNRLSTASLDTFTSTSITSPSPSLVLTPTVEQEPRSHSHFLSFFGRKTPANDGEGRTMPVISGPIPISNLNRSSSMSSMNTEFGAVS